MGKIIEANKQTFPPKWLGSKRDYHAMTRGFIVNEIFRRVDIRGRTIGEFVRQELCDPLGGADVFVGLPESVEKSRMWDLQGRGYTETFLSTLWPDFLLGGRRAELGVAEIWTMYQEFKMDRSDRKAPKAVENITRTTMMAAFNSRGIRAGEFSSASARQEGKAIPKFL